MYFEIVQNRIAKKENYIKCYYLVETVIKLLQTKEFLIMPQDRFIAQNESTFLIYVKITSTLYCLERNAPKFDTIFSINVRIL